VCGGKEGFEDASDSEQGYGSGEEADGFCAGQCERVAASEHSGKEESGGETEAGAAGDEDAGEFERTVGGDEAPHVEGHVMLGAGCGDDSDAHPVGKHEKNGPETGEDPACVGVEADGDVVCHDAAGFLRFGGENRVGPHLMVFYLIDHLRAQHGVHELRTGDCEQGSEKGAGKEDGEGGGGVGQETTEDSWIAAGQEVPDARETHSIAGVDVIVGATDETVEVCFEGAGGLVGADSGEVGCGLAVEQAEFAQVG